MTRVQKIKIFCILLRHSWKGDCDQSLASAFLDSQDITLEDVNNYVERYGDYNPQFGLPFSLVRLLVKEAREHG